MKLSILVSFLLLATAANAQECTSQWTTYFDTNPLHSKYLTGDTTTGYAVFNVWGNPDVIFELRGKFPKSRFHSYETESTRLAISVDHLFDHQIEPEPGSQNPFREGVALDTPNRDYRVFAMQNKPANARNTIELPDGRLSQAIMMRIYTPNDGLTLSSKDLPRVFAYDRYTGQPTKCPRSAAYDPKFHFPQFLAGIYTTIKPFEFKTAGDMSIAGLNKAAGYMYAVTKLDRDEVVKVRFRSPNFLNTQSGKGTFTANTDVRYWSICTNNFPKNQTLNCLPDFLAKPDTEGYVTVIVGTGNAVKAAAESRGYSFLPDARLASQRVMGFVYRNLVPSDDFKEKTMYQGAYAPTASVCTQRAFLNDACR